MMSVSCFLCGEAGDLRSGWPLCPDHLAELLVLAEQLFPRGGDAATTVAPAPGDRVLH
jgi:hypothetical protein